MAALFGGGSTPTPPAATLRIQHSLDTDARPLIYGVTRIAGNILWYNDFHYTQGTSGGKGGLFASGSQNYNYFASIEIALCEGPIVSVAERIWKSKALTTLTAEGLSVFLGTSSQAAWSYVTTQHPTQALAYRYTCHLDGNLALGVSPELPNYSFEVTGAINGAAAGIVDANLKDVLTDFLGNPISGVPGWSSSYNGDWTNASNYWLASGLFVSVALTTQTKGSQWLDEILTALNVMPVWTDAVLKLVPRGDKALIGNGASYTPPAAPLYDLDDTRFLPLQGGQGGGTNSDPVSAQRKAPRDQNNVVKVEYIDRSTDYNLGTVKATNDVDIRLNGERGNKGVKAWHFLQTAAIAQIAAQLALGREQINNNYSFTLPPRFILLDPGDIVSITDAALGLSRQWVRILDIQENADRSLTFSVEEYLLGTGAAPLYGQQANTGARPDYNADPGATNTPVIFEPTDELAGALEIWAAVSGVDTANYGGCDCYVSNDATGTYQFVGRQSGATRMGVTTAVLPSVTVNPTGAQTIDNTNTLSVDLSESGAALQSGTNADAAALNTACWVGGEVIAYATATLTAANRYDLTYLIRGAFGTDDQVVSHPVGTAFVRLDSNSTIVRIPYDQGRIGSTIYVKFVPFNPWGGGGKTLADVAPVTYVITGLALASPLPNVEDLRTAFVDGRTVIDWTEITDFRPVRYEIRVGNSFDNGLSLGTLAHPPFPIPGDGIYWVSAVSQPISGLIVYSETASSIDIGTSLITTNVVATWDEKATGWTGDFSGGATLDSGLNAIYTGGPGGALVGYYTIPAAHVVDVGYVAPCAISIQSVFQGIPYGQDILSIGSILDEPDILGASSAPYVVNSGIEIAVAQGFDDSDIFDPSDVFSVTDIFAFGPWQKFTPGVYVGRAFTIRAKLETLDLSILAYCTELSFLVDVPDRIDYYTDQSISSGGTAITFTPRGQSAARPFNGGPDAGLPHWDGSITNLTAGDEIVVQSLTVSGCTVYVRNAAGSFVNKSGVNLSFLGW